MTVQQNLRLEEARPLDQGMGVAVGRRTVFRESDNEDMGRVADRVASGNMSLTDTDPDYPEELTDLRNMIARGALPTSGRHLQHGDLDQAFRNIEVFTNCASAALCYPKFYLLLNGAGVGRNYSDDMMVVNWANSAYMITLLSEDHPDYPTTDKQLFQFAKAFGFLNFKFEDGKMIPPRWVDFTDEVRQKVIRYRDENIPTAEPQQDLGRTIRHTVDDSREGWAKALEQVEAVAHSGGFDTIILDFSQVRENGAPIAGMQDRPASGPLSVMRAFLNVRDQVVPAAQRGEIDMWEQAMVVDHLFSVEVQVGGARRAARMAVKYWKDKGIFRFIRIKTEGGLWTSNNSIGVDQEFWDHINWIRNNNATMPLSEDAQWAWQVFLQATECAFINGEPGFISLDRLESNKTGKGRERPIYTDGRDFGSEKYKATEGVDLLAAVAEAAKDARYPMIVNPCVTGDTWVQTDQGLRQVKDLVVVPFKALVDGQSYASNGFWKTGVKEVFRVKTDRGYEVRLTGNHEVLVETDRKPKYRNGSLDHYDRETSWVEAQNLKIGDQIVVNGSNHHFRVNEGEKELGWLIGQVVGDGGFDEKRGAYVRFWGEYAAEMAERSTRIIKEQLAPTNHFKGGVYNSYNDTWQVGCVALTELVNQYVEPGTKNLRPELLKAPHPLICGFLQGFFDADGSAQGHVNKGRSIRLAQSDLEKLKAVQLLLSSIGIQSTIYEERKPAGKNLLPDGWGSLCSYQTAAFHELAITRDNINLFNQLVGFAEPDKQMTLDMMLQSVSRSFYRDRMIAKVVEVVEDGVEPVYDCTVDQIHCYSANGLIVHNCGEVELHTLGAYCVIGDIAPLLACPFNYADTLTSEQYTAWDDDAEQAVRLMVRFLMRVNLMDALYGEEVKRTNRIGVSLTGIHEWAYARFGYTFHDLIDESKSQDFWNLVERLSDAAKDEAWAYADTLGVEVPHTIITIKPAGTTSKLYGLSEGAHLPAMRQYLRWVQYRGQKDAHGEWSSDADPLLAHYEKLGYPIRELESFPGMSIVGFPTVPLVCYLMSQEEIVTANEATPEEQYKWLMLLEKYWLGESRGNQVSYTMKIYTTDHSLEDYRRICAEYQSQIRACALMPQVPDSQLGFEYLPEQEVSLERFEDVVENISETARTDIDMDTLECASGACPI